MTREEAKDKMLTESVQYKNGLRTVALRKINNFIDKIFDEHEKELKQAYIDGSNSNNKLIQFYLKTIEVKDKKIEILTSILKENK